MYKYTHLQGIRGVTQIDYTAHWCCFAYARVIFPDR